MTFKEKLKGLRSNAIGFDPGFLNLFYKLFHRPKPNTAAGVIEEKAKGKEAFRFLQIGGNDGFINDPLFKFIKKYPWKGIIVEPQREVFENRLKRTYRNEKKVILRNLAIADEDGTRKLYKLAISKSRWASGLATFDRQVLVDGILKGDRIKTKARQEGIELPEKVDDYITYEEVPCRTIKSLLAEHGFDKLDLLQIDTEGFDYEIIKTINLETLKPGIIAFEHSHLNAQDKEECKKLLESKGYSVRHFGGDTVACL